MASGGSGSRCPLPSEATLALHFDATCAVYLAASVFILRRCDCQQPSMDLYLAPAAKAVRLCKDDEEMPPVSMTPSRPQDLASKSIIEFNC